MTRTPALIKILVYALVFLFPSQLALHFWPSFAYVFGIRIDYLAPTVFFTDLLFLIVLILRRESFFEWTQQYRKYLLFFVLFAALNIFFSKAPIISFLKWLKILEGVLLSIFIFKEKNSLGKENIIKALFCSAVFFSLIGISQFVLGGTTGLFYLLGERSFYIGSAGLALVQISGRDYLRAYSVFPHPNALAGYLGALIILFAGEGLFIRNIFFKIGLLIIFLAFLLTFSLSALIGLSLSLFVLALSKRGVRNILIMTIYYGLVVLSLLLPIFSSRILPFAVSFGSKALERLDFAHIAGRIISEKFWIGTGLNTFILNIPNFKGILAYSWVLQPVHNIFLLIFSETGIGGVIILFLIILNFLKSKNTVLQTIFLFVVVTGFLDHYWLTLQQNILLIFFLTGFLL